MDLSKLSDQDFQALQSGNLRGMSDAGFAMMLQAVPQVAPGQGRAVRMDQYAKEIDPTAGMSGMELGMAGFGKAFGDLGLAVKQALGMADTSNVDEVQRRDAPLMAKPEAAAGYVAGSVAKAVPVLMAPGGQSVLGASIYGGALGALEPIGSGDTRLKSAARSALLTGAATGATSGASWLLNPSAGAPQAAMAAAGNNAMTPGQSLGGPWKRVEDALTSLPFSGDLIKSAQRRGVEGFNVSVANRALAPIGKQAPANLTGRDLVQFTERALGDAYESALQRMGAVKSDAAFVGELSKLSSAVKNSVLPKDVQAQFNRVVQSEIKGKFLGQQAMTPQTFKQAESEIGRLAARYASDPNVNNQLLGDALQELQASLRRLAERSAGPQLAGEIKAANAGWAEFKRMQRAATFLGAKDGVFSAENYMNAVKALDKSKDKGGFARGSALGQDFASDALATFGATVPDSGTPFRTLMSNPVGGAISAGITGLPVAAIYNDPVMRAIQTLALAKRPALATKAAAGLLSMQPAIGAGALGIDAWR